MKKVILTLAGIMAAVTFGGPAIAASPGSGEPPGIILGQVSAKADIAGIATKVAPTLASVIMGTQSGSQQSAAMTAKTYRMGIGSPAIASTSLKLRGPAIASSYGLGGAMASATSGSGNSKADPSWAQAHISTLCVGGAVTSLVGDKTGMWAQAHTSAGSSLAVMASSVGASPGIKFLAA